MPERLPGKLVRSGRPSLPRLWHPLVRYGMVVSAVVHHDPRYVSSPLCIHEEGTATP